MNFINVDDGIVKGLGIIQDPLSSLSQEKYAKKPKMTRAKKKFPLERTLNDTSKSHVNFSDHEYYNSHSSAHALLS